MNRHPSELAIAPKYQRQLERARVRRSNDFFVQYIEPRLYCPERDWHVPLFDRKEGTFSQFPLEQIILQTEGNDPADILPKAPFLTNPLKFADYDASKKVKGKSSGATPAKLRVTNSGMMVLTHEYDGKGPESLEQQLDWFLGKPEDCQFSCVHKALSKFADYRGYFVVFSGNKSLHIDTVWDTTHLSKKLTQSDNGPISHWSMDVPDEALAPLHRMAWTEVAGIIQSELNIEAQFDCNVSSYYAKRRSPWGIRVMDKQDNIHGFNIGDRVEQIMVQERILSRSAPGVQAVLLCADKVTIALEHGSRSQNRPTEMPVMADEEVKLLEELTAYLRENGWPEYPKPVALKYQSPSNTVNFKNHVGDKHPSTFISCSYRSILPAGIGAPSELIPLPNNLTLDETLKICRQRIAARSGGAISTPSQLKQRPDTWSKRFAQLATSVDQSRRVQGKMLAHVPDMYGTTCIQGLPGSGKTHSLMANVQERRWDDDAERHLCGRELSRGFIVVASPSYEQAADKHREFNNLDTGNTCAVVLKATSELYKRACKLLKIDPLNRQAIGQLGHSNFLDGVKTLQPNVYDKMFDLRDAMWKRDGQNLFHPNHTIVFATHELLKHWPNSMHFKAFLHPDFPKDYTEEDIERCCREMSFYRVIYDEVVTDDLVSIDPAEIVQVTRKICKKHDKTADKPWDESTLIDQVRAYEHVMSSYIGLKLDFDNCNRIIRTKYRKKKHRYSVDAQRFPFGKGTENKNMYAMRNEKQYYCKPQNWWQSLGCPVIILTTEDLPTAVFKKIDHRQHKTRCLSLMSAPYLFQEYVPVVFDERARSPTKGYKSNCRTLALELLSSCANFVIGNKLKDIDPPFPSPTCSHVAAKGRNDLKSKSIATIISYPATKQYDKWAILGSVFGIDNPIQLAFRDIVIQDVGRNTGFRRGSGSKPQPHKIYIKPSLYRDLECFQVGSDVPFKFFNQAA